MTIQNVKHDEQFNSFLRKIMNMLITFIFEYNVLSQDRPNFFFIYSNGVICPVKMIAKHMIANTVKTIIIHGMNTIKSFIV